MSCTACAARVERTVDKLEGVSEVVVNLSLNRGYVLFNELETNETKIVSAINELGYEAMELPKEETPSERLQREKQEKSKELGYYKKSLTVALCFSLPLLLNMFGELLVGHNGVPFLSNYYLQWLLATPVQFWAGARFYKDAYYALRSGTANMSVLVVLGTTTSYLFSVINVFGWLPHHMVYFETAAVLITLVLLGKFLEARAKGKTSEAMQKLMSLQPQKARVVRCNEEVEVSLAEIILGDTLVVLPGERVPVDGKVSRGSNVIINESMLTGESIPVEKSVGDMVFCGTINHYSTFYMEAVRVGGETMLAHIVSMVENAQYSKPPIQRIADKISARFVPAVVMLALLTFSAWFFLLEPGNLATALMNFTAVLVVSCPCALGLATPTSVTVAMGKAAEKGILFKNGEYLEVAGKIQSLIFDKTGTITEGKLRVSEVIAAEKFSEGYVLQYAASLEKLSEHPIGRAVYDFALDRKIKLLETDDFNAVPGQGATAIVNGSRVHVGKREYLINNEIDTKVFDTVCDNLERKCRTVMWLAVDDVAAGLITLEDKLRENAVTAVKALKQRGVDLWLVTGDNWNVANAVGRDIMVDNVVAEAMPANKMETVAKLKQMGYKVAMVGDGINDAPALAAADVGIAMSNSIDAAMEAAQITIVNTDLHKIAEMMDISKATIRNIRQNFFWAFVYNIVAIPLAAAGLLSPMIAGAAMAFSSLSVVMNSLRLKRL